VLAVVTSPALATTARVARQRARSAARASRRGIRDPFPSQVEVRRSAATGSQYRGVRVPPFAPTFSGGLRPAGPPIPVARGAPCPAPLRRAHFASLVRVPTGGASPRPPPPQRRFWSAEPCRPAAPRPTRGKMRLRRWPVDARSGWGHMRADAPSVGRPGDPCRSGESAPPRPGAPTAPFSD
jgi:hypothetical protein